MREGQTWNSGPMPVPNSQQLVGAGAVKGLYPDTPTNSRIRDGITYLEGQMSELHSLLTSLESRVETVTTPVPPMPTSAGVGKDSSGPISHLFDRLQCLSGQVNEAQVRVRSLLSRIEI